ncbi:MAG: rRNA maturation RNase YbeY [Gemmatimonadaceae bacterium]
MARAAASIVTNVSTTVRNPGIAAARVKKIVAATLASERIANAMISVSFVGRTAIARMNQEYLGHAGATDVISFGMGRDTPRMPAIGDIYICPDVARANARRAGVPVGQELTRLVVHGLLHVTGHDHPDDDSRTRSLMWKRQERIVASIDR